MGLHQAFPGAYVIGIDSEPQPNYPFLFMQMDWLEGAQKYIDWAEFFWCSPVCKRYTQMLNHGLTDRNKHPDFIPRVRKWLLANAGKRPWVIENVAGAPLLNANMLCGEMFGLRVMRHRFFETSFAVKSPKHPKHDKRGAIRKQGDGGWYYRVYGHETGKASWGAAMGIDWMRSPELAQAIPPAYSRYIGEQFKLVGGE
jgi:DNA (cytosine-5)-methyltransferase 1